MFNPALTGPAQLTLADACIGPIERVGSRRSARISLQTGDRDAAAALEETFIESSRRNAPPLANRPWLRCEEVASAHGRTKLFALWL
jgi:hypothetical protein